MTHQCPDCGQGYVHHPIRECVTCGSTKPQESKEELRLMGVLQKIRDNVKRAGEAYARLYGSAGAPQLAEAIEHVCRLPPEDLADDELALGGKWPPRVRTAPCNAKHTSFSAGEHDVHTIGELRARIAHLPDDTPVVMDASMVSPDLDGHQCSISLAVHRWGDGKLLALVGGGCLAFTELEPDLDLKCCASDGETRG